MNRKIYFKLHSRLVLISLLLSLYFQRNLEIQYWIFDDFLFPAKLLNKLLMQPVFRGITDF